ncbi:CheY-like superfamily [Emericellopsis atlantica]|uniref:CheY-like superfamily n=1 Tax=Emericellopsis atlantica TaxID=2614577 RepID=A0A9P7ZMH3_9HYPO|nr:CheY-like superfamily [Emericellopsis atlantica]KAG9254300.1 CheY-like superfamily [Emericellopsis atlantica]
MASSDRRFEGQRCPSLPEPAHSQPDEASEPREHVPSSLPDAANHSSDTSTHPVAPNSTEAQSTIGRENEAGDAVEKKDTDPQDSVPATHGEGSSPTRFLLVDDNPVNRKIMVACMNRLNCQYTTATNGQEAADAFRANPRAYRCVFMDSCMPVLGGLDATRQIRAYEREHGLEPTTVIGISAGCFNEKGEAAQSCGISMFLRKPFRIRDMQAILEENGVL